MKARASDDDDEKDDDEEERRRYSFFFTFASFFPLPPFCIASELPSALLFQPPTAPTEKMTSLSCSRAVARAGPSRVPGAAAAAKPVNDFNAKRPLPLPPLRPFRPRPSVSAASSPSSQGEHSGGAVMWCRRAGSNSNGFSRKEREKAKAPSKLIAFDFARVVARRADSSTSAPSSSSFNPVSPSKTKTDPSHEQQQHPAVTGPDYSWTSSTKRSLALELVRVTEAAALAGARHLGRGDKNAADKAAVDIMRRVLNTIPMDGVIVIGVGECCLVLVEGWGGREEEKRGERERERESFVSFSILQLSLSPPRRTTHAPSPPKTPFTSLFLSPQHHHQQGKRTTPRCSTAASASATAAPRTRWPSTSPSTPWTGRAWLRGAGEGPWP